ncbi:oligosaccharide flippase family protein, partial [Clostridium perfringens]
MKEKSLTKNYIYNLTLTSINIIFPLITSPYLSYILGVENIGKVNYSTSIINWFILFSSFGIPRYGIREIARKRESKKELNITFWNLIIIQFIFTIISSVVYIILVLNSSLINDWKLYFIMLFMLVLNIFSIDWFYQGIEEYEYITKRNICIKVLSLILIFLMVRNRDNYLIYASINVFAMCFNNVLNYL